MPTPAALSRAMIAKSRSISRPVSAAVGSSITMMRACRASAFAISMSCCWPTESRDAGTSSGKLDAEFVEHAFGSRAHRALVDQTAAHRLDAEHDVLGARQLRNEVELLIDHPDAEALGGVRRVDAHRACRRRESSPSSARLRAGENLHERRFSGAVFADERVHFAGVQRRTRRRRARERRETISRCRAFRAAVRRSSVRGSTDSSRRLCVKVPTVIVTIAGGVLPAK